jgi:hypothetical protein
MGERPAAAFGRRTTSPARISDAHASELVANLPARRNVHPRPDVRIRRSISAWITVIGWVCCSKSSSTVNEET